MPEYKLGDRYRHRRIRACNVRVQARHKNASRKHPRISCWTHAMEKNWHYSETGQQSGGPVSTEDLGRILAAQNNSENFLVWSPGMSGWVRAGNLAELKQY